MEQYEYEVMAAVEDAHWWYRGMRAISAAWLDQVYNAYGTLRVLDAGCGTGGNGEFLRRYGDVIGLDLSPLAVQLAQRRLPAHVACGSVVELPFRNAAFDLVTSFDVLYHRAVGDEVAALRETARVLQPGGRLLIRLPAYQWLLSSHDRSVHGVRRYTATRARRLLDQAGFAVERVSYANSLLFPLAAGQRLIERRTTASNNGQSDLQAPHPIANAVLQSALYTEAAWLHDGGNWAWGLSVLVLARKEQRA